MQHPWLQPPTPTVASHVYASVWSQVRLWVWLCVQSSSTNCVYMYFVIPRYLAIRAAQAPCLAAPPTPTLHPHPPCTRTHPALAPTLCPLCRLTAPTRVTQPHLATHAAPALRPAALCPHCALPAASARRAEAPTAPLTAPRRPRPTQHLRCRHRRTTPRPSTGGARCWRRVWCRSPPAAS